MWHLANEMLLPNELAASTGRPERFLAMHFANEIWKHNTAEIMGHGGTDPAIYYQTVVDFARRIGMEPIELHKEQARLHPQLDADPVARRGGDLILDGVAEPETIDKTWRIATGMQQGPCEVMDQIGLNTIYEVNAVSDKEKTRAAGAYLKEHYVDKGKLGRPSGEGFYNYAAGELIGDQNEEGRHIGGLQF
jgi:3-hydroxyacyl-CoA dehydrogenase